MKIPPRKKAVGFVISDLAFYLRFLPFLAYYQLLVPGAFWFVYHSHMGTLSSGTHLEESDSLKTVFAGGDIPCLRARGEDGLPEERAFYCKCPKAFAFGEDGFGFSIPGVEQWGSAADISEFGYVPEDNAAYDLADVGHYDFEYRGTTGNLYPKEDNFEGKSWSYEGDPASGVTFTYGGVEVLKPCTEQDEGQLEYCWTGEDKPTMSPYFSCEGFGVKRSNAAGFMLFVFIELFRLLGVRGEAPFWVEPRDGPDGPGQRNGVFYMLWVPCMSITVFLIFVPGFNVICDMIALPGTIFFGIILWACFALCIEETFKCILRGIRDRQHAIDIPHALLAGKGLVPPWATRSEVKAFMDKNSGKGMW